MELHLNGLCCGARTTYKATGVIYLSDIRIVFIADRPSQINGQPIQAYDFPLGFVSQEEFNQPIFGCNNLSGAVRLVNQTEVVPPNTFKLFLLKGGINTFLPLFYQFLHKIRQELGQPAQEVTPRPAPSAPQDGDVFALDSEAQNVVRNAFVDPSDPTTLYVEAQPVAEEHMIPSAPEYPSRAAGLRRRRPTSQG